MHQIQEEVVLLRRWDPTKLVDHYAVGLPSESAWQLGQAAEVVVELLPSGIYVQPRLPNAGWQVVGGTTDLEGVIERLVRVREQAFDLPTWNCEHFARFVVSGKKESSQIQIAVLAACLIGIVVLFRR